MGMLIKMVKVFNITDEWYNVEIPKVILGHDNYYPVKEITTETYQRILHFKKGWQEPNGLLYFPC